MQGVKFFILPLFNADCIDCELKTVDLEYKGNLQSDPHRAYYLMSSISNPKHPFSWFAAGNTETLKGAAKEQGLDLREELIKFYHKYYSADIMHLVVVGNHSLDMLSEWSLSKIATALKMAISSANEAPRFATLSKTNFASFDMKQSPEGIWLINDYKQFQQTQALHGISVPSRKLVPPITESALADNN
ncbi:metalloprotease [Coemansia sp. RSA 2337]|nr:metalloprotease [Coemansia sp. RSA 2337]